MNAAFASLKAERGGGRGFKSRPVHFSPYFYTLLVLKMMDVDLIIVVVTPFSWQTIFFGQKFLVQS
jgi:hypothetical protein